MVRLSEAISPKSRVHLALLKEALIIAPAVRGKEGNAAFAAARRALRSAGVKKPKNLKRLLRMAKAV
ncbi:MAG: hypothetical protein ACPLTR_12475 [Thermacetogeniaceae bacterium]